MVKKVLVTGAHGQLGKTIRELYEENNIGLEFDFVSRVELDITNKDSINVFFKNNSFNYCINCAAYTNVEQAEKTSEMAYRVNSEGVKYLADSCKKNNVILIHISTDYVFDGKKKTPYTPQDRTSPINEYGKSKLLGEQYVEEILKQYFIIRTSWLYSKKYGRNFYRRIIELSKTKKELTITTEQLGCPTNTESLAKFIINLIKTGNYNFGIRHFSDGIPMTWYDFAKQILTENDLINKTNLVEADKFVTLARRPKNTVLLCTKKSV